MAKCCQTNCIAFGYFSSAIMRGILPMRPKGSLRTRSGFLPERCKRDRSARPTLRRIVGFFVVTGLEESAFVTRRGAFWRFFIIFMPAGYQAHLDKGCPSGN